MREEARFWVDDAIWDLECVQEMLDNATWKGPYILKKNSHA